MLFSLLFSYCTLQVLRGQFYNHGCHHCVTFCLHFYPFVSFLCASAYSCICACVFRQAGMRVCAVACGGQRSELSVPLNHSPPSLLSLELFDLSSFAGSEPQGCCLWLSSAGIISTPDFWPGCWKSNSGPHSAQRHFANWVASPATHEYIQKIHICAHTGNVLWVICCCMTRSVYTTQTLQFSCLHPQVLGLRA